MEMCYILGCKHRLQINRADKSASFCGGDSTRLSKDCSDTTHEGVSLIQSIDFERSLYPKMLNFSPWISFLGDLQQFDMVKILPRLLGKWTLPRLKSRIAKVVGLKLADKTKTTYFVTDTCNCFNATTDELS